MSSIGVGRLGAGSATPSAFRRESPPDAERAARTATDDIPIRRPHFRLRGSELFFLISRRPFARLDAAEVELWRAIDGESSVAELGRRLPGAEVRVRRLREAGLVEVAEPRFADGRRRILVVEPHMDDAILSVGGQMWARRHECAFTVLSVVGLSNFTSYFEAEREFFDVETVSALRREESRLVMRLVGGEHRSLDVPDAPLRYRPGNWDLPWFRRHRRSVVAGYNISPQAEDVASLEERLTESFASVDFDEIWIPMGIGPSHDHELTRDACLGAVARTRADLRGIEVCLYQEVPYCLRFPDHVRQILEAIVTLGGKVEPVFDDIREALPDKLRLVSIFGSQFKPDYMAPKVQEAASRCIRPWEGCGELRFRLSRLPDRMDRELLYSGRGHLRALSRRLEGWYRRNRDAERIRMLIPTGVGRWKDSMRTLLDAFPSARFEVHISSEAMAETGRFTSSRIRVVPVPGGLASWGRRMLELCFASPRPTIAFTSLRMERFAPVVRAGLFRSDVLSATTMDHLVQALRRRRPAG